MRSIINLWKNECIKLTHQTSNRVIIIIALVLSLLLPIVSSVVVSSDVFSDKNNETYESFMASAESAENNDDYLTKTDLMALANACKFFEDNEFPEWKEDIFYREYCNAYLLKLVCEAVIDEKVDKQLACDYYSYLLSDDLDDTGESLTEDVRVESYGDYTETEIDVDAINFESLLQTAEERLSRLEKTIPDMTIEDYANGIVTDRESQLKDAKLLLNDLNTLYENGETTVASINQQKVNIEAIEFEIGMYKALADADPEDEDWMMNTLYVAFPSAKGSLISNCPVDKATYLEEYDGSAGTYDEYVEKCEKIQSYAREALITFQHAFENGIPLADSVEHSTKQIVHFCLGGLSSIIILVMVIITATTIAGEYSQGTIRLLVIRPRTKTKIILSKFLAIFTIGALLTISGFVLVYILSIVANGVKDVFAVDLMYSSRVIEINAFVYSIVKFFLPVFSGILLVALAFMMAVVTRKAMLSIILPVIISMSSAGVQTIAVQAIEKYPIIRWTVLPYLDLGSYLVSPLSNFTGNVNIGNMLFGGMSGMSVFSTAGVSLLYGVIIVAIHILALFVVSFVVFKRQQIKN